MADQELDQAKKLDMLAEVIAQRVSILVWNRVRKLMKERDRELQDVEDDELLEELISTRRRGRA